MWPIRRPGLDTRKFILVSLFALCLDLLSCVSDESGRLMALLCDSNRTPWERKCFLMHDMLLGVG